MDRSFLSQTPVIEASRAFVCIRLATYEHADEAAFLKKFTRTGSGELENSVFGILAPDGKQKLIRSGRSPNHEFGGPTSLAEKMNALAKQYPGVADAKQHTLPRVANIKLGVNVAAADLQPLVAIIADEEAERTKLANTLATWAWHKDYIGRFVYAVGPAKEASMIQGKLPKAGIVVVTPEAFGRSGQIIAVYDATQPEAELPKTLQAGLVQFRKGSQTFTNHVREGHRQGIFWEPPVPVSDPMEKQARERGKRGIVPKP